jgi:ArsR family transcriptional regulator, lead/cadmium/zinc/bismuth-responsive transcriptional repressor
MINRLESDKLFTKIKTSLNNYKNLNFLEDNLDLLKSLSVKTRFLILKVLILKERCACELPSLIGSSQSNTSMHLAKLLEKKILNSRREGRKIIYSIRNKKIVEIFKILDK